MPNFIQSYDNSGIANGQNPGNSNYLVPDAFLNLTSPTKNLPFPGANSSTIHLEPRVVNFTTNTLGTTKQIYNTKLPSDIQALAEYFGDWGMSYQITEGPMFKFSVDVPWDSITGEDFTVSLYEEEQWELIPVQGNKSLTYSGLLVDPFAPMTNTGNYSVLPLTLQSAVNRAIKTGGNGLNPTSSLYLTPAQQTQYAAFVPEVNKILAYSYLGVDGVVSYTQQLKRTAVVDVNNRQQAFQLAADYATATINNQGSVNYILSTPDMIKNYTIRENVWHRPSPLGFGALSYIAVRIRPLCIYLLQKNGR